MTLRVGVIGTGVMGSEHARLLNAVVSGVEVAALYDVDAERVARVAADIDGARRFDDPMVLIKDDLVDAVLIASSDATHAEFVLACIAAGKPVLCEKPLAPDTDGCLRIVAAEVDSGRRLVSVGFMRRYDPGYRQLRGQLDSGDLGRALMLHCTHRNQQAPNVPTAALISGSAVHEIDIARWLLADELVAVTVHRPRRGAVAGDTQDPLFLVFESATGILVDVEVYVNAGYGYDVRCELLADQGAVCLDAPPPTLTRLRSSAGRSVPADWRPRFAEAYRLELQDWVDTLTAARKGFADRNAAPELATAWRGASGWDGYVATAVAEAGIRALHSGVREQITLSDKPDLYSQGRRA
ncbi:MAG TPA: Gfo/Idh/MocA family oxidoreductase [Jatrophihabitans sp.]|jgi:myo-inositol 2-dehydrogenase/D-chiro-inositol 1-dehydrogenase